MKESIYLFNFYFKKLFNLKNFLFAVITFFLFFTLFRSLNVVINATNDSATNWADYIEDFWNLNFFFITIYGTFFSGYIYLYLKKINFSYVDNKKNTFINLSIVSVFLFFYYMIFYIFYLLDYVGYFNTIFFTEGILLSLFLILFNICSILFISFFNNFKGNNNEHKAGGYLFLIITLIMNLVTIFLTMAFLQVFSPQRTVDNYIYAIKIELIVFFGLIILNFIKRFYINKRSYTN